MTMRTSARGLAAIAAHEGIVLDPYRDSVGVWTIGIGHTAAAGAPDPRGHRAISLDQALAIFAADLPRYEAEVLAAVTVKLEQHELDALVSFHFNTGGIRRAALTRRLNAGDRRGAAAGFLGWVRPAEIRGRREAERRLFATGVYPAPVANVYRANPQGTVQWSKGLSMDVLAAAERIAGAAPGADQSPPGPALPSGSPALREGVLGREPEVRALQSALARIGIPLVVDGRFGPGTAGAVRAFQAANGLTADGIAGPRTMGAISAGLAGDGGRSDGEAR